MALLLESHGLLKLLLKSERLSVHLNSQETLQVTAYTLWTI